MDEHTCMTEQRLMYTLMSKFVHLSFLLRLKPPNKHTCTCRNYERIRTHVCVVENVTSSGYTLNNDY